MDCDLEPVVSLGLTPLSCSLCLIYLVIQDKLFESLVMIKVRKDPQACLGIERSDSVF